MFIEKTQEVNLHRWTSKTGKIFYKSMPVVLCHFVCDNCAASFTRRAGDISPARLSSQYSHYCSNCGDPRALAGKKGTHKRRSNLKQFIGETWIDSCGYRCVYMGPDYRGTGVHGGAVREHVLVMEKLLGRSLNKGEVIHHIDGNKTNNSADNLQIMSVEEHNRCHGYNDTLVLWMYNIGLMEYNQSTKTYALKDEYCRGQAPPPPSKKRRKD